MKNKFYNAYLVIIGINIVVFLLQFLLGDNFTASFQLVPSDVWTRPWTLLTSMFLHGGAAHILFNMYALLIFGGLIEQRIGTKRFIAIYLIGGLFAGVAYSLFYTTPALGASGAIMTVLGLTIMLLPDLQVLFFFIIPMSMRTAGIIFVAIDVFGLFNPASNIAHLAHLGGLFIGLVYGYYLIRKKDKLAERFGVLVKKKSRNKHNPNKPTIELSDEDIEEYIKNGRL